MADFNKITKEQFDTVYNSYLPSKWVMFAYKHFSNDVEKKNLLLKKGVIFILIGLFLIGFVSVAFDLSKQFTLTITYIYLGILLSLATYLISAIVLNNIRISKICKKLDITKEEYNDLVENFYGKF